MLFCDGTVDVPRLSLREEGFRLVVTAFATRAHAVTTDVFAGHLRCFAVTGVVTARRHRPPRVTASRLSCHSSPSWTVEAAASRSAVR